jgi:CRISPR-associated protein Csd2
MANVENRYDFIYLFDVKDGNPNGDPDAGNLPRMDTESGHGLVTDVCLKRKIRNYVQLTKNEQPNYEIYIKEKAVLGRAHVKAFKELGIAFGSETKTKISNDLVEELENCDLPNGISLEEDGDEYFLVMDPEADVSEIKKQLKDTKELSAPIQKVFTELLKGGKTKKISADESDKGRKWMCQHFFDIRAFGAVMSLKSAPNCGQVRGPIQLTFARSIEPIVPSEHSITRMAVATEKESEKNKGDNRTMGRKFTVPYGLYRTYGFISAPLAEQTGFSSDDLDIFWDALQNMFEHDRSAARGLMSAQRLIIFKHKSKLGNVPVQDLFNRITVERKGNLEKPARDFSDYVVKLDDTEITDFRKIIEV